MSVALFGDYLQMCHVNTGKNWDRPIELVDLALVWDFYRSIGGDKPVPHRFVSEVYNAITNFNSPQPIVLVTIVDLYYRWLNGLKGDYPWVSLPFSALDYHTGVRLMAPSMEPFHGVFAMFSLAQRNIQLLRSVLVEFGVDFVTFHDCGCFMPDRDDNVFDTSFYQNINLVRSHYEALGGAVEVVPFEDRLWKSYSLDMGKTEIDSYIRMTKCLFTLPVARIMYKQKRVEEAMNQLPFGSVLQYM